MDKCTGVSTAWLLIAVLGVLCNVSIPGVLAENPIGSFFVNCGSTASYVDKVTGITWMPDDQFIDKNSGVNTNVSSASQYYSDFSEFTTLRYFPDSRAKNCYRFPVTPNATYQIRGTFFYGNYDNQTTVPSFQMGVDGTIVASNIINELYVIAYQEITYVPQRNVTFLCLSRDLTNSVPFISAISLVNVTAAPAFQDNVYVGYYYVTQFRWNFGGNGIIRYPGDIVDHYWFPIKSNSSYVQSTAQVEALTATGIVNAIFPPEAVMNTALTTNGTMTINVPFTHAYTWFSTLYFAELNPNASNSSREFYLGVPGYSHTWVLNPLVDGGGLGRVIGIDYDGIVPNYVSLFKNQSISTALGPLVNALEIFELSQNQSAILTNEQDNLPACWQLPAVHTNLLIREVFYGSQPLREQMPNWHASITENQGKAAAITSVPTANFSNSNTPMGPFHMTVLVSTPSSSVTPSIFSNKEYWVLSQTNVISLCLSRDSSMTNPFISAISLRWFRAWPYPGDIVDHYWFPIKSNSSYVQSTAQVEALTATGIVNAIFPPEAVMNTALTTNGTMTINVPFTHAYTWFSTLYFAELNPNASNSSREFYVGVPGYSPTWLVNPLVDGGGLGGSEQIDYDGVVPNYISLFKNQSISTALGPLVNALEIFELSQNQSAILTNEQDTLAIEEIKSSYGNLGVWTGDPCLPYPHPWVTCSNVSILQNSSSIIAVNLSGYGLTGPISPSFGKLSSLTSLVLENNELNGLLPDFSQFPNLTTLNLSSNQLNGPIPPSIWDIPKLKVLDLSNNNLSGNLVPITSTSCPMSLIILNLGNNSLSGSFPSNLLDCSNSTLQEINFDYNNFSGTLNMTTWDQVYLIYGVFISMVYNDISTLDPSWGDDTKTYSPILLGGNPICKSLQYSSDPQISYRQQLNCRYNNTVLHTIVTVPSDSQRSNNKLILILSTTLSTILLFGGIIGVIILWKYRTNALALREIQQEFAKQQVQPTLYSYNVLSKATGDFHQDNKLGEGGFGVVYKEILLDGTKLAKPYGVQRWRTTYSWIGQHDSIYFQLFTKVAGTITKVDVYSFGILLLEIISGRKAILQNATSNMYLVEWAWTLHKTNMLISLVDQKLHNTIVESEMRRVINVALLCVQVETTKRPIMSQVLSMLQGEMDLPDILVSPNQTSISNLSMDVSTSASNYLLSSPIPNNYSNAEIELTNLDPR
ncbi:unnamed protein product [Sphagnum compactum]